MAETFQQYELNTETFTDENGPVIFLTQPKDYCNEPDKICLHPWQLRAVCEKFGIVEPCDPHAQNTIATLQRRMVLLRDRIDRLHNYLVNHSDHKHADLSYEVTYATACIDLADEFCADFEGVQACTEAPKQAPEPVKPLAGTDAHQLSIDV